MKLRAYFFVLLLIIGSIINGMQLINDNNDFKEKVLYSSDILSHITWQLCMRSFPKYIRQDIRALSDTNKFFHDYYSAEKNKQTIIRTISRNNYDTDQAVAISLCCHTIVKKIDYFCKIACSRTEKFTQEDLKEIWYLNVMSCTGKSLLYMTTQNNDWEKAQLIIDHSGLDLSQAELLCIGNSVFFKKLHSKDNKDELNKICAIYNELQKIILLRKSK
jgi:hypothetical protein